MQSESQQTSNLRKAREAHGLTQARMAARLGISPGWYSLIEREPTFLTERLAQRAAELLGVPVDRLRG